MDYKEMYEWWNNAAKTNAHTAILSGQEKWDDDDFFATGESWLNQFQDFVRPAGRQLGSNGSAMDFGCGLGRMTHAFAGIYDKVVGVDISDEMVRKATDMRRRQNTSFVQVLNPPLPFEAQTFDLVSSSIVVQHIPAPYNMFYIDEFFRVSSRHVLFDAPSNKRQESDPPPVDGIFLLDRQVVFSLAKRHGFELIAQRWFPATETRHYQYLFERM